MHGIHFWTYHFAANNLAKDIGIGLLRIKSARVVIIRKLRRSIGVVESPSSFRLSLIAQTCTGWLPGFVEGLEVEDVLVPAEQSTNALFEKGIGFIDAVYSISVTGSLWHKGQQQVEWIEGDHTSCRPSSFAIPQLYRTASHRINLCVCPRQVVEIGQAGVADRNVLPVTERVYQSSKTLDNKLMVVEVGRLTIL